MTLLCMSSKISQTSKTNKVKGGVRQLRHKRWVRQVRQVLITLKKDCFLFFSDVFEKVNYQQHQGKAS